LVVPLTYVKFRFKMNRTSSKLNKYQVCKLAYPPPQLGGPVMDWAYRYTFIHFFFGKTYHILALNSKLGSPKYIWTVLCDILNDVTSVTHESHSKTSSFLLLTYLHYQNLYNHHHKIHVNQEHASNVFQHTYSVYHTYTSNYLVQDH